ncbi:MAG: methyltransferase [Alteraurantiacibacter sp.]
MIRQAMIAAISAGLLAACSAEAPPTPQTPQHSASNYGAAIADIARPAADRERDASRKPGELLAFAEIDAGDKVGDYIMGGGYVTRLLALAVGSEGRVYAFQPEEFIGFRPEYATEQDAAVAPYADNDGNPRTVFPLRGPIAAPSFPEQLDTIITVMNLHDLFISQMPEGTAEAAIKALYDALKPGGSLVVVDHLAKEGSGAASADTLHRMDPDLALNMLTAAGFVLEQESELYSRPDDPREANVFDEAIRGKTDQFAWRLRKPATAAAAN